MVERREQWWREGNNGGENRKMRDRIDIRVRGWP
jgi:hypothetical protein